MLLRSAQSIFAAFLLPAFWNEGAATGRAWPCEDPHVSQLPFCNSSLSSEKRALDLVQRMTVAEKVANMHMSKGDVYFVLRGVPRLGVPEVSVMECLHGVGVDGQNFCIDGGRRCPTSFPLPIGLASSFNESLWAHVGAAIGREARALANLGVRGGGLICWAPTMNLARDPRWGRTSETPGEDPFLTTRYAFNTVRGLQGSDESAYLKTVATCKHAIANNLDNWCDDHQVHPSTRDTVHSGGHCFSRGSIDERINAFDMASYFLPAWEGCVRSGARSMMMSENAVNGRPNGASATLMSWFESRGFKGFFSTDCGGIEDVRRETKAPSWLNATAQAINAGISTECPGDRSYVSEFLPEALSRGLVNIRQLNRNIARTLAAVIDLGVLDSPRLVPWHSLGEADVDSEAHRRLALEASQQSVVLLQNKGGILPLDRSTRVALIGPYANATDRLLGQTDYHGVNRAVRNRSILDALKQRRFAVNYVEGCRLNHSIPGGVARAVEAAREADVVVLALGLDERFEDEGLDRFSLELPKPQIDLLNAIAECGARIVLLLLHGGALGLEKHITKTSAIIDAFYPGQFGGVAIAQILAGEVSPSGVLPVTYYPSNFTKRNMTNFDLRSFDGLTYQHYKPRPVFPFGFGLSYTRFIVLPTLKPILRGSTGMTKYLATFQVANVGAVSSAVPLLAFVRHGSIGFPRSRLGAFSRIHLSAGELRNVTFVMAREAFLSTDEQGIRRIYPGTYNVNLREASLSFELVGPTIMVDQLPHRLSTSSAPTDQAIII